MNAATPKQFLRLGKHNVLYESIQRFLQIPAISEIIVVIAPEFLDSQYMQDSIPTESQIPIKVIAGGNRRQDSVYNGLNALASDCTIVCIHDGVRPFVQLEHIQKSINFCDDYDGAIVAAPSLNTLKECHQGIITETVDRNVIWQAQTPQTFRKDILIKAYDHAIQEQLTATDDSWFVEKIGGKITIVEGSNWNIKITGPTDLLVAQAIHEKEML